MSALASVHAPVAAVARGGTAIRAPPCRLPGQVHEAGRRRWSVPLAVTFLCPPLLLMADVGARSEGARVHDKRARDTQACESGGDPGSQARDC